MQTVMVTGMGVVSAIGHNSEDFSTALKAGLSGIKKADLTRGESSLTTPSMAALIEPWDFIEELKKLTYVPQALIKKAQQCARRSSLATQACVISALQAWQEAGFNTVPPETERISVVLAGQNINQRYSYQMQEKYAAELAYLPPQYGLEFMDSYALGVLSEIFHITGEGILVAGASASGNMGIIQAHRMVQWGLADIVMLVAAPALLTPLELQAWHSLGAMSSDPLTDPETACRPFDRARDGFVYGQGSACLMLESEASANRRAQKPMAKIAAVATCLDANRLSNPSVEGEVRVMREALAGAKMQPSDVHYINAHGSASVLGDETEIAAIKRVFADTLPSIGINSTKSLTGHCLYAAGLVEAVATILQMNQHFLHPNLNLEHPLDDECSFVGSSFQPHTTNVAINNSFGFGGINSAVVFQKSR